LTTYISYLLPKIKSADIIILLIIMANLENLLLSIMNVSKQSKK